MDDIFLSTPSARRATRRKCCFKCVSVISIHALREEGDAAAHTAAGTASHNFYPRPPRGGRQGTPSPCLELKSISIHALREEGDRQIATISKTSR